MTWMGRKSPASEQRAAIRKYVAEYSNAAAVKKFKGSFDGQLGENTKLAVICHQEQQSRPSLPHILPLSSSKLEPTGCLFDPSLL